MNSIVGPTVSTTPAAQSTVQSDESAAPRSNLDTEGLGTASTARPSAGNGSGLLQSFVLPKTSLDAFGLLRPSNQGDSEVLISQVTLIADELAGESENAQAEANGAAAAALAAFSRNLTARIADLRTQNADIANRVEANSATQERLNNDLATLNVDLTTVTAEIDGLNAQIASLQARLPMTPEVAQEIQNLTNQVQTLTAQSTQIRGQILAVEAQKTDLESQIFSDVANITSNESAIRAINQNILETVFVLAALRDALQSSSENIDASQGYFLEEITSQNIEEFLPNMQRIFEVDLEDEQIQDMIENSSLSDEDVAKAVALTYGLAGSFFEGLGIFLQQANLVELDLDSVARANNESQRMQIAL